MKLGFIKPNYPFERRVAILPSDINDGTDIVIEQGFGVTMNISDDEYRARGCNILPRDKVFETCNAIYSLKLIQETDYDNLRNGHVIIGWTHPTGSGAKFFNEVAKPKNIKIVDLDNIFPRVYHGEEISDIEWLPRNFIWKNSYFAGYASVSQALQAYGLIPNNTHKVAILSSGNVSQGAFSAMSPYNCDIRMFYRKTMNEFYSEIDTYDIIINGIEVDEPNVHIIDKSQVKKLKRNALIIDAAADAGNAIEGSYYTAHDNPLGDIDGINFYCVNNAPTIFYRTASNYISEVVAKYVLPNVSRFVE